MDGMVHGWSDREHRAAQYDQLLPKRGRNDGRRGEHPGFHAHFYGKPGMYHCEGGPLLPVPTSRKVQRNGDTADAANSFARIRSHNGHGHCTTGMSTRVLTCRHTFNSSL